MKIKNQLNMIKISLNNVMPLKKPLVWVNLDLMPNGDFLSKPIGLSVFTK